MRVRLFQEYNEYSGEYYFEITQDENANYWEQFFQKLGIEQDLIDEDPKGYEKKIPNFDEWESKYLLKKGFKFNDNRGSMYKICDERYYFIDKGLDEWYLIHLTVVSRWKRRSDDFYYKCDQWEGLVKFLNDFKL